MADFASPSIKVIEEQPKLRNIVGVSTNVVGFVGIAERGPFGPQLCNGPTDYENMYGGFTANSDLAVAVQEFFRLGGKTCYIVRTVHYTDPAIASTKTSASATLTLKTANLVAVAGAVLGTVVGPFSLNPGDTLIGQVDGNGSQTATVTATAASRTSANGTFNMAGGKVLTVAIDGGANQTVTFIDGNFATPAAATAQEVINVINASILGASASLSGSAVVITSDRKGTGSIVNVSASTAATALTLTTGAISGTGNVSNVKAVTVSEIATMVQAAWTNGSGVAVTSVAGAVKITSNTTGASSSVLVVAASTADTVLGLDNAVHTGSASGQLNTIRVDAKSDGAYANDLRVKVETGTAGVSGQFNIVVLNSSSQELERFSNLSLDAASANYCVDLVNASSNLIQLVNLSAAATSPSNAPVAGTFGPMTGGGDGLAGLVDNDFLGLAAGATGMHGLDSITTLNLLGIPARSSSAAVANGMISYCESDRSKTVFAVLDPPAGLDIPGISTYVDTLAASEFAALYYPRLKILNPLKAVFGNTDTITIAPSGGVLGVYARTDATTVGGVYEQPAGIDNGNMPGVLALESNDINIEAKYDQIYPKNVNGIVNEPGIGVYINGVQTLKRTGLFPTVAQRRGAIFIEQSVKNGLKFAKFQAHTAELRNRVRRTITAFLTQQMAAGAFASTNADEAFLVDVSEGLNTPQVIRSNKLIVRIGIAMASPAQFIELRFSADTRALDGARLAQ